MTDPRSDDSPTPSETDGPVTEPAAAESKDRHRPRTVDRDDKARDDKSDDAKRGPSSWPWKRWLIAGFVVVLLILVAVFIWTSFLPRWWSQTISRQTGGTFAGGVGLGLLLGLVCTLVPLLILGLAVFRHWKSVGVRVALMLLAVITALPNLMTLSVALGPGRANEVARTTMDVSAPWFRGSTLIGAIIAAVLAVIIWILGYVRRRRGRELKELKAKSRPAQ